MRKESSSWSQTDHSMCQSCWRRKMQFLKSKKIIFSVSKWNDLNPVEFVLAFFCCCFFFSYWRQNWKKGQLEVAAVKPWQSMDSRHQADRVEMDSDFILIRFSWFYVFSWGFWNWLDLGFHVQIWFHIEYFIFIFTSSVLHLCFLFVIWCHDTLGTSCQL